MIIGCFFFGFFVREEVAAVVTSGAPLNKTMIRALIRCRMYPEEMAVLTNPQGKKCTVPLPPGTTHFQDGTYLTSSGNFDKYLEFTLLQFGWTTVIRQNETVLIRDKTGYKKFKIINNKYAGNYRRLKFVLE
jgi:hypothetical protein